MSAVRNANAAEGIFPGVKKPGLEPQKGLIVLSERIKRWPMKLNGSRWSRAVGHMGNVGSDERGAEFWTKLWSLPELKADTTTHSAP